VNRALIIPAAGRGTRLQASIPKVLFPVNGRPMIDYLFDLYRAVVDRFVLVLNPDFVSDVEAHCSGNGLGIEYEVQETPTGMLDAILIPHRSLKSQGLTDVWITWCDQIAVRPATVQTLAAWAARDREAAMIFPTFAQPQPYIHLERDATGTIRKILQRREGDVMPEQGEADMGLFHLSADGYFRLLPAFAAEAPAATATRERNFLPFAGWLSGKASVRTFPGTAAIESIGVNSPDDLRRVEAYLRNDS
jgi:bifunctional UDP-N-acetylglucosamine pyrophosphorylase / glucosamine-1-phosphate N-acetyltransferase